MVLNKEQLRGCSKWASFTAIMLIIFGILSALGGLFAFVIGAAPGVLMTIAGIKLLSAKKRLDEIISLDASDYQQQLELFFVDLKSHFLFHGISYIVGIVFSVVGFIIYVSIIASMLSSMPQF